MRGATAAGSALPGPPCNFNPRAPCGARLVLVGTAYLAWSFQSTRPMRGATEHPESQRQFQPFQSTRPMRGATYSWPEWRALRLISIHAPHAGRDSSGQCAAGTAVQFQSTRPMRGATCAGWNGLLGLVISIHAPHAGRDGASREPAAISAISIHAPHAGRDLFLARVAGAPADFNPRAPCGARRTPPLLRRSFWGISIHAPHAGRDSKSEQISLHIFAKKAMSSDVFGAKRRLLKRFSAYNTGKPF